MNANDPSTLAARLALRERELAAIRSLEREREAGASEGPFLAAAVGVAHVLLGGGWVRIELPAGDWLPEMSVARGAAPDEPPPAGNHRVFADGESDEGRRLDRRLETGGGHGGRISAGRDDRPWDAGERELLGTIRDAIGSALRHYRQRKEVDGRRRELDAIFRLDRLIDRGESLDATLEAALRILHDAVGAEWSCLLLATPAGIELRAGSHPEVVAAGNPVGEALRREAEETAAAKRMVRRHGLAGAVASWIGIPLVVDGRIVGVFGGGNPPSRPPFGPAESAVLEGIASQMDMALFEDRRVRELEEAFGRYVSPEVVRRMLSLPDRDWLRSERATLTMLFSDMRNFTGISEELPASTVAAMLDEHLAAMTEVIRDAGGTVDKFVGDEVVAFFGAPIPSDDHALAAVRTARRMQARHRSILDGWKEKGLPQVAIGIGLSTGEVVVGNIGSTRMMNYTVIGREVNLAARLCGVAGGGEILVSEATWRLVSSMVRGRPVEPLALRHISRPVPAWSIDPEPID